MTFIPWVALLLVAAAWDVRARRIPNALSLLVLTAGVGLQLSQGAIPVLSGLASTLLVVVLLWIPWSRGRIGGGDVKLGAAAAALIGLGRLPAFLLMTGALGGVVAGVCFALSSKEARAKMRANLAAAGLGHGLDVPARATQPDGRVSVPYGVAFAAAAILTVCLPIANPFASLGSR